MVEALCGLLPEGSSLAVTWQDGLTGAGGALSCGAAVALRRQAELALNHGVGALRADQPGLLVYAWENIDSNACMAIAASLPRALVAT
ncbi:MAG TPA: hypothetical protein VEY92_04000, partial [Pseudoxanthomonas sp.]|nr:hypothetical protein [Pseudoxanthomonas sp.]